MQRRPLLDHLKPVVLTNRALTEARNLAQRQEKPQPLRVYIDGKGCDGFYYGVSFDDRTSEDIAWQQDGIELIIDAESLRYMRGSSVDWVDDERGRGFLVDNPQHRKYRGKFYKRKSWQQEFSKEPGPSKSQ